jgi:hypothetical protein
MSAAKHTVYALSAASVREADAAYDSSKTDGVWRQMPPMTTNATELADTIQNAAKDCFVRYLADFERGTHKPKEFRSFAAANLDFVQFIRRRIPITLARPGNLADDELRTALIPFTFRGAPPTEAEREAWIAKWDDNGPLLAVAKRAVPRGMFAIFLPFLFVAPTSGTTMMVVAAITG